MHKALKFFFLFIIFILYFILSTSLVLLIIRKLGDSWGTVYACFLWAASFSYVSVNVFNLLLGEKFPKMVKSLLKRLQLYALALFSLYFLLRSLINGAAVLMLFFLVVGLIRFGNRLPLPNIFTLERFDGPIKITGLLVYDFTIFLQLYPLIDFEAVKGALLKLGDEILILRSASGECAYLKVSSKHILRKRGKEAFLKKIERKISEGDLLELCLLRVVDVEEVPIILSFNRPHIRKGAVKGLSPTADLTVVRKVKRLNASSNPKPCESIKSLRIGENGEEFPVKLGYNNFNFLNDRGFAFCKSLAVLRKVNDRGQGSIKVAVYEEGNVLSLKILSYPIITLSREQLRIQCALYSIDPSTFSCAKKPVSETCLQKG